jgi:hypothetical protein
MPVLDVRLSYEVGRLPSIRIAGGEGGIGPVRLIINNVPMTDTPKSSFDLVMERLRKKDADAGVEEKPLTDEQRAAIAEARSVCEAKTAQRRIMHASAVAGTFDPAELEARALEFRRDIERFAYDRDAKIAKIRAQGAGETGGEA